jgi:predicted dehydrogenase
MGDPLRIGVIGLGRRWRRRYGPALRDLPDCFQVRAVYDQVRHRAEQEARSLHCPAHAAVTALLDRDDIDALLLADPQWFGAWPITAAGRAPKPVYCHPEVLTGTEGLPGSAGAGRPPVMVELLPRFAPAGVRLRELLREQIGPARMVICERVGPGGGVRPGPAPFTGAAWISLLDWCRGFVDGGPAGVLAAGLEDRRFESVFLEFPEGRAIHVIQRREPHATPRVRLHVAAEKGSATLELPRRVSWNGPGGRHVHTLPHGRPLSRIALRHFYQAVRTGQPPEPGWDEVGRSLAWLQAARQSQAEGRRVVAAGL